MTKEIRKDLIITGEQLNNWFKEQIKKYPNCPFEETLTSVFMEMTGDGIQDNSLETFLKETFLKEL